MLKVLMFLGFVLIDTAAIAADSQRPGPGLYQVGSSATLSGGAARVQATMTTDGATGDTSVAQSSAGGAPVNVAGKGAGPVTKCILPDAPQSGGFTCDTLSRSQIAGGPDLVAACMGGKLTETWTQSGKSWQRTLTLAETPEAATAETTQPVMPNLVYPGIAPSAGVDDDGVIEQARSGIMVPEHELEDAVEEAADRAKAEQRAAENARAEAQNATVTETWTFVSANCSP